MMKNFSYGALIGMASGGFSIVSILIHPLAPLFFPGLIFGLMSLACFRLFLWKGSIGQVIFWVFMSNVSYLLVIFISFQGSSEMLLSVAGLLGTLLVAVSFVFSIKPLPHKTLLSIIVLGTLATMLRLPYVYDPVLGLGNLVRTFYIVTFAWQTIVLGLLATAFDTKE